MAIKTVLFALLFAVAFLGGFLSPIWSVLGYVGHYTIGPERQWWHAPLSPLGIRYSLILALTTAVGIALHWNKLRLPGPVFCAQEKLLLAFLALVWLSVLTSSETIGRYGGQIDHPSVKITKVILFVMMLSQVATNFRDFNRFIWVLIIAAFLLGIQAYSTPYHRFQGGRLEGIGGPDFTDSTYFAAFQASVLPLIGAQFMRSRWPGKIFCLVSGAFVANAVILTRTRGAVVGLALGCLVALALAPRKYRAIIVLGLIVAGSAFFSLTDQQFLQRAGTITRSEETRDKSAQSRIVIWRGAVRMFAAHPLGVGAGNFYQNIGNYTEGGQYPNMAAHNTFLQCPCELGIQGAIVFLALIACALLTLRKTDRIAAVLPDQERLSLQWLCYGMVVSLVTMLGCCLTISLLYVEFVWWFLAIPICLARTAQRLASQHMSTTGLSTIVDADSLAHPPLAESQ